MSLSGKREIQTVGVCKLTGEKAKFARSHIIPRALAKPRPGGQAFAQLSGNKRPVRRRDSWYDLQLTSHKGESLLRDYDTWGITELRRTKLVWQSWGPMMSLTSSDFVEFKSTPWGFRKVLISNPSRLRLFLLSILWRAASTTLDEFAEIKIRSVDLKKLTKYVRDGALPPYSFFPVSLTQISTIGFMHNLGAIAQIRASSRVLGVRIAAEPIFRFYFDGLVAHFYIRPKEETLNGMKSMFVGSSAPLIVPTVTFEQSWQLLNFRTVLAESEDRFPGGIEKAEGRG